MVLARCLEIDAGVANGGEAATLAARPPASLRDIIEVEMAEPKELLDRLVLVGYGEMAHFWTGINELQFHFRVGHVLGWEANEPAERRQFGIHELSGPGMWQSADLPIRCFKPDEEEVVEPGEPTCWFRCVELYPCEGISLTNTASGETIRPEFIGLRLMVRYIESRDKYYWHREQYFNPQEIMGLLRFAWLTKPSLT